MPHYRITFGSQYGDQEYGADPHPRLGYLAHRDGYVTVTAADSEQARELAVALCGTAWSNIYDAAEHQADEDARTAAGQPVYYPRGELLRLTVPLSPAGRVTGIKTLPSDPDERRAALSSGDYDAAQVHEALLYTIVCVRVGVDPQAAINVCTLPAGTSVGWRYVERGDLPDAWWEGDGAADASPTADPRDAPYPQPCGDHTITHVHVLAAC